MSLNKKQLNYFNASCDISISYIIITLELITNIHMFTTKSKTKYLNIRDRIFYSVIIDTD